MPGARCHAKAGQDKGYRRPGQSSGVEETMVTLQRRPCRSALRAYGWRGTVRAQVGRKRRGLDLPGVYKRKDTPRVHRQALTESRDGKGARKRSPASGAHTCLPLRRGERYLLDGPVPGGCTLAPQSPRRTSMTATRGGAGGGRLKEDPALPNRGGLMNGTAETSGRGAERRAQRTESRPVSAGQPPRGRADPGHHRERRRTLIGRGT
jgi:hypothetical protein